MKAAPPEGDQVTEQQPRLETSRTLELRAEEVLENTSSCRPPTRPRTVNLMVVCLVAQPENSLERQYPGQTWTIKSGMEVATDPTRTSHHLEALSRRQRHLETERKQQHHHQHDLVHAPDHKD